MLNSGRDPNPAPVNTPHTSYTVRRRHEDDADSNATNEYQPDHEDDVDSNATIEYPPDRDEIVIPSSAQAQPQPLLPTQVYRANLRRLQEPDRMSNDTDLYVEQDTSNENKKGMPAPAVVGRDLDEISVNGDQDNSRALVLFDNLPPLEKIGKEGPEQKPQPLLGVHHLLNRNASPHLPSPGSNPIKVEPVRSAKRAHGNDGSVVHVPQNRVHIVNNESKEWASFYLVGEDRNVNNYRSLDPAWMLHIDARAKNVGLKAPRQFYMSNSYGMVDVEWLISLLNFETNPWAIAGDLGLPSMHQHVRVVITHSAQNTWAFPETQELSSILARQFFTNAADSQIDTWPKKEWGALKPLSDMILRLPALQSLIAKGNSAKSTEGNLSDKEIALKMSQDRLEEVTIMLSKAEQRIAISAQSEMNAVIKISQLEAANETLKRDLRTRTEELTSVADELRDAKSGMAAWSLLCQRMNVKTPSEALAKYNELAIKLVPIGQMAESGTPMQEDLTSALKERDLAEVQLDQLIKSSSEESDRLRKEVAELQARIAVLSTNNAHYETSVRLYANENENLKKELEARRRNSDELQAKLRDAEYGGPRTETKTAMDTDYTQLVASSTPTTETTEIRQQFNEIRDAMELRLGVLDTMASDAAADSDKPSQRAIHDEKVAISIQITEIDKVFNSIQIAEALMARAINGQIVKVSISATDVQLLWSGVQSAAGAFRAAHALSRLVAVVTDTLVESLRWADNIVVTNQRGPIVTRGELDPSDAAWVGLHKQSFGQYCTYAAQMAELCIHLHELYQKPSLDAEAFDDKELAKRISYNMARTRDIDSRMYTLSRMFESPDLASLQAVFKSPPYVRAMIHRALHSVTVRDEARTLVIPCIGAKQPEYLSVQYLSRRQQETEEYHSGKTLAMGLKVRSSPVDLSYMFMFPMMPNDLLVWPIDDIPDISQLQFGSLASRFPAAKRYRIWIMGVYRDPSKTTEKRFPITNSNNSHAVYIGPFNLERNDHFTYVSQICYLFRVLSHIPSWDKVLTDAYTRSSNSVEALSALIDHFNRQIQLRGNIEFSANYGIGPATVV